MNGKIRRELWENCGEIGTVCKIVLFCENLNIEPIPKLKITSLNLEFLINNFGMSFFIYFNCFTLYENY
jgi:hypothetical protein